VGSLRQGSVADSPSDCFHVDVAVDAAVAVVFLSLPSTLDVVVLCVVLLSVLSCV
jgi:hypothetical protein